VITVPFSVRWRSYERARNLVTRSEVYGLLILEPDALVLQYRLQHHHSQGWVPLPARPDSGVVEARIPLEALRSARLVRGWWRTRMVLSAADLRAFEGLPGLVRDQLVLTIDRAHRTDAADLASSVELALTTRLLDRSGPDPRLPAP
jgi:hypothetical protein